jgi:3-deoxy-D-manno-octulosonic-acid transferase
MFFLYSLLIAIGVFLASPYFLFRGLQTGKYFGTLGERFGGLPPEVKALPAGCIWIHAVSVGEAVAALPLARQLKQKFPARPLVISTTTETGQKLVEERFDFADAIIYFPFDWAWIVRRVLRVVRPACVLIVETEIWPNFMRQANRAGVPVIFVNGRISQKSFRRHERALRWFPFFVGGFYKRVLNSAALFLMQSESDAERVRKMGATPGKVFVTGNLKYDSPLPEETPFVKWLGKTVDAEKRRPLIVAGSVTSGEESLVLIAFGVLQGQMRDALLVLAPRKPDRFNPAAQDIVESLRKYVRRSAIDLNSPTVTNGAPIFPSDVSVLLLDTIGELAAIYGLADAVYVGGSMVEAGGHNILEPAGFGKPPLFGVHMENFQELANNFLARGAARQVTNPEDLGVAWIELLEDSARRKKMGEAARAVVEENRGATARTIGHITEVLGFGSSATRLDAKAVAASEAAPVAGESGA